MATTRRRFLGTTVAAAAAISTARGARRTTGEDPASEFTLDTLRAGMESGRWTSARLTRHFLDRIERLDAAGPALRSVIEVNPDALALARTLDRERKEGRVRGPLHGIPILIKDNLDTADRMATTAGSLAMVGARPREDAGVVRTLREAGALILGKTNLSEWANIRSNHSTSGWSSRGGLTRNPYALDRNTSGSSSGSAVAVAATLCAVAVGTETDGSIVSPSSVNGVVGIKPTHGLISGAGIIPIAHSQDTAGPMARTVRDAALLLEAMAGRGAGTYTASLDPRGLRGARLGVVRNAWGFDQDRVIEAALVALRAEGAELIDPANLENGGQVGAAEFQVLLYELKADLNAYLANLQPGKPVSSLDEVIAFNEAHRDTVMPYFGQETLIAAASKGPLTDEAYLKALATSRRLAREEGIDAVMNRHRLDALVAPTGGPAWMTDLIQGDRHGGSCSTFPAVAGYPHVTVPGGSVHGLPAGLSFFGRAGSEALLLKLAYSFEQATRHRREPRFLPTAV